MVSIKGEKGFEVLMERVLQTTMVRGGLPLEKFVLGPRYLWGTLGISEGWGRQQGED